MKRRTKIATGVAVLTWGTAAVVGVSVAASPSATYTVRQGDTLSAIAERHSTTVLRLAVVNNIANPDMIIVGQRLTLPAKTKGTPGKAKPAEDSKGFDCRKHGNKICGPAATLPGGKVVGPQGYHCHPAYGPDGLLCAKGNHLWGY